MMNRSQFSNELPEVGPLVQQLLEYAPDAIIAVSRDRKIIFANSQAESMFGYASHELVGNSLDWIIPERFHEAHWQHEIEYLKNPTTRPMGRDLDLVACRKDKSEFPVDVSLSPLKTELGVIICASIRDVSEKKKRERKIQQYAKDLERSNRELESFAQVAAHDLRGPLRRVQMVCELIQAQFKDELGQRADDLFSMMNSSIEQMQALIKDLLDHSKVGADHEPFQPVDTSKVLNQVLSNLDDVIKKENITITSKSLPTVHGERIQLCRLFHNLLGNAITYRTDVPLNIVVGAKQKNGHWEFQVQDNGIGIESEYHDRIFEIFQRLHSEEKFPGTGIGLATCKKIVELHGGEIWVESEPGKGSTFCFTIPNQPTHWAPLPNQ